MRLNEPECVQNFTLTLRKIYFLVQRFVLIQPNDANAGHVNLRAVTLTIT